jgi:hypothetical protein
MSEDRKRARPRTLGAHAAGLDNVWLTVGESGPDLAGQEAGDQEAS